MKNAIQAVSKRFRTTSARRRAMRDDSGQALVELSVGLTLCVVLIVGAAEFGRLAYASIEVSNAAHAGAAYGAQTHTSAKDDAGMQLAATNDGPNVTALTATSSHFCSCADGSSSTCLPTDCAASHILVFVEVDTTGVVDPYVHGPGLPRTYTLTGKAVMRVVQ